MKDLSNTHKRATLTKRHEMGIVIDHLVAALGGDPSCTLRRAIVLCDIDEHQNTTQADIMNRLELNKSALNRDIEWLYDHGCIIRQSGHKDARVLELRICGYAKKNLDLALAFFGYDHKNLKNFLYKFKTLFSDHKPTLRDAKILTTLGIQKIANKQDILDNLYDGPVTTDSRALAQLVDEGLLEKTDG